MIYTYFNLVKWNVNIRIYNKCIHDNIKTDEVIMLITPFSLKNGTLDSKKNIIAPIRA